MCSSDLECWNVTSMGADEAAGGSMDDQLGKQVDGVKLNRELIGSNQRSAGGQTARRLTKHHPPAVDQPWGR